MATVRTYSPGVVAFVPAFGNERSVWSLMSPSFVEVLQRLCLFLLDLVISISKAVVHHGVLLGVAGLDISVSDIAEDIVYFSKRRDTYSFLVEKSGEPDSCHSLAVCKRGCPLLVFFVELGLSSSEIALQLLFCRLKKSPACELFRKESFVETSSKSI